jgi:hypothetical protein
MRTTEGEYAREQLRDRLERAGEPVKLDDLIKEVWSLTGGDDPRWIMVGLGYLHRAGEIRYPTCGSNHNHNDTCMVQLVAS